MPFNHTHEASLVQYVEGFHSAQYLALASFCILIYEYFVLLPEEVRNFWHGPKTTMKCLFLLNRYMTPVTYTLHLTTLFWPDLSISACDMLTVWTVSLTAFGIIVVEAVLVLRVYILYSGFRKAQLLLLGSFLGAVVASGILIGKTLISVASQRDPAPRIFVGCFYASPWDFWAIFVPPFVFESVLFVMTLVRALCVRARTDNNLPILNCLIRDGAAYFLVAFLSLGFTSLGSISGPELAFPAMQSNFLLAALSTCSSRLLLHMRSLTTGPHQLPAPVLLHDKGLDAQGRSTGTYNMELPGLSPGARVTRSNGRNVRVEIVVESPHDLKKDAWDVEGGGPLQMLETRVEMWDEKTKERWRASEDWHQVYKGK